MTSLFAAWLNYKLFSSLFSSFCVILRFVAIVIIYQLRVSHRYYYQLTGTDIAW